MLLRKKTLHIFLCSQINDRLKKAEKETGYNAGLPTQPINLGKIFQWHSYTVSQCNEINEPHCTVTLLLASKGGCMSGQVWDSAVFAQNIKYQKNTNLLWNWIYASLNNCQNFTVLYIFWKLLYACKTQKEVVVQKVVVLLILFKRGGRERSGWGVNALIYMVKQSFQQDLFVKCTACMTSRWNGKASKLEVCLQHSQLWRDIPKCDICLLLASDYL